jgi:hypothetical protein
LVASSFDCFQRLPRHGDAQAFLRRNEVVEIDGILALV